MRAHHNFSTRQTLFICLENVFIRHFEIGFEFGLSSIHNDGPKIELLFRAILLYIMPII